ncbi:ATP-binding cassette domain-containing protein [Sneathiella chungangensis]|uniref:ATP-binding cassette domain-containing protein n=1 Tax=Sneathiella chungangensis TaxID=1418234 RepID=A0A845MAA6_9PROT|nr:sugar ABC transporter ATP-binding protein [Sneathiella chungangensis]MZR21159.1 ATP-binding cassette domain-containing protein [Sneathiella chungangensis]
MDSRPLVQVRQAVKTYGSTRALSGVTLDVHSGEVVGIVGHNGAGKSTLMRVLSGLEGPDSGTIEIDGVTTPPGSGYPGVRMAYQEGSLALELTVKENIFLSSAGWMPRWRWHGPAAEQAIARLSEIFPNHSIRPADYVDDLPLADRQMVEIARATITDDLRVLILDEPTESLSGGAVEHLYNYVRKVQDAGLAIILVSHRLKEILSVCDRVAVMKDGAVVKIYPAGDVSEQGLFDAMGGEVAVEEKNDVAEKYAFDGSRPVTVRIPMAMVDGRPTEIVACEGEVIGLAGIAGQGQEKVLDRLWHRKRGDVEVSDKCAYVPGDRQRSGILPIWNVAENLSITALSRLAKRGIRQIDKEKLLVAEWVDLLNIRGGAEAEITGLSGGNQQKVIVARAFASEADTILLDDPFRGVDVHTKVELYQLIRTEAEKGRTIIWYSSENSEMQHCDRAYVLRAGRVAGELHGAEITDERMIAMSFAESEELTR